MIFTRHLLSHFIDISSFKTSEICTRLSSIGLEVESVAHIDIPSGVVVGKIISCYPHPNADKLSVCEVSIGTQTLQIVCGASNVCDGAFVAVALEGAIIPHTKNGKLQIKKTILRDVESCGMLCSSAELGLPATNKGIMILDKSVGKLELGVALSTLALFDDDVIEVAITPNRGDCLSVLGIARELAACYGLRLKSEIDIGNATTLGLGRVLQILTDEKINASLLYRVVEIKQAHLPLDIALILAWNGTLLEDVISNYLEYGTYMSGVILNAYKLHDCQSDNVVLDNGLEAQLKIKKDENGLESVFANKKLSTIGVTHGKHSFATRGETLVIEASYINPVLISSLVHKHKINGDVALMYRSKRGTNPNLEMGMNFLCKKMLQSSEVLVYSGTHNIAQRSDEVRIRATFSEINQIIGTQLEREDIAKILKQLNFSIDATCDKNFFMITVPPYRADIESIQDVSEEVLRIYGIDNIKSEPLKAIQSHNANNAYYKYKNTRLIAHNLITHHFTECIHYLFSASSKLANLGFTQIEKAFALLNPITNELDTLRTSLLPTLLDALKHNKNLGFKHITLFEIGSVYNAKREERTKIAMLASGFMQEECYPHPKPKKWDFFSFAAIMNTCVGTLELKNISDYTDSCTLLKTFGFENARLLHPYQSAFVFANAKPIGIIARLHPQIVLELDIDDSFICEIELNFEEQTITQAKAFSKFPTSLRDLTVLINKDIPFYRIRDTLQKAQIPNISNIYPLDVYDDASLGDKMALSIRFVLQNYEQTLQEADLNQAIESALNILTQEFNAILRS